MQMPIIVDKDLNLILVFCSGMDIDPISIFSTIRTPPTGRRRRGALLTVLFFYYLIFGIQTCRDN